MSVRRSLTTDAETPKGNWKIRGGSFFFHHQTGDCISQLSRGLPIFKLYSCTHTYPVPIKQKRTWAFPFPLSFLVLLLKMCVDDTAAAHAAECTHTHTHTRYRCSNSSPWGCPPRSRMGARHFRKIFFFLPPQSRSRTGKFLGQRNGRVGSRFPWHTYEYLCYSECI